MKQSDRIKELLKQDLSNAEITMIINKEYNVNLNRNTVAKARQRMNETIVEANDEEIDLRKPTKHFNEETEIYIIRYGINKMHSVSASNENIRKAFMMHKTSIGNLTENQVALEMKWTKREFQAIKRAFDFTKDAAPFTDHDIERLSSSEMAEYERIEKKRYALLKLETKKHDDIKKEIVRHNKADYFVNRVAELFNAKEFVEPVITKIEKDDKYIFNIRLCDIHAGLEVDNIYNQYNLEEVHKRFDYVLSWIKSNIPGGSQIILTDGGDTLHGLIHGSVEKHGTYVVNATVEIIKCYEKLITGLLDSYFIQFAKVNGSHEALEKNKQNRTEEENLGNLITFSLERIFANYIDFEVILKLKGLTSCLIPLFNYHALLDHGDNQNIKKYSETAKILNAQFGYNIKEVWLAHFHHYKAEFIEGIFVEHTEPFGGTDQYASKLGLNSPNGFRCTIYNQSGRVTTQFIRFEV